MTVNPMRGAATNATDPMMRSIALVEVLPVPFQDCKIELRLQFSGVSFRKGTFHSFPD
jgi:hypothetical protein